MKQTKREKLERAGFSVGTVQQFLHLSDEEMALIDLKIRLISLLKSARQSSGLSQANLAKLIGSSQSRVAKMENADAGVSLELICKALFSLGVSRQAIGRIIASQRAA
jgi:ribosome-binding protein aMBF1 (putative translation factor)